MFAFKQRIFAQQIGTLGIGTFSERIYTWLLDEKPINYRTSDA